MKAKRFLNIDEVFYLIKSGIPEDDRVELRNFDSFAEEHIHFLLECMLTDQYYEHMFYFGKVKDFEVDIPDIDCLISVCGTDQTEPKTGSWRRKYVGEIQKAMDGCTYSVHVECDQCTEPDCKHPVALVTKEMHKKMKPHDKYALYEMYYGVGRSKDGKPCSQYMRNFFRMCASTNKSVAYKGDVEMPIELTRMIDEYRTYHVYNGRMKVGFETGEIVICYKGKKKDKRGRMMIPNIPGLIKILRSKIRELTYEHLYFTYKSQKYERAWARAKTVTQEDERNHKHEIYSLDIDEVIETVRKYKNKALGRRKSKSPSWIEILDHKTLNY